MDSAPSLQVRHSKAGCKRSQPDPRHPSKVSTSQIPCSSGVIAFATASKESFFRLRPPENRFAYLQASEPDFGWNKFVTAGSADGWRVFPLEQRGRDSDFGAMRIITHTVQRTITIITNKKSKLSTVKIARETTFINCAVK